MGGRSCRGKRVWCARPDRILRLAPPAYLLIEAFLTLTIGSWLGPGPTLLLLALGAAAGIAVLRTEQFSLLSRLRQSLAAGEPLVPGCSTPRYAARRVFC